MPPRAIDETPDHHALLRRLLALAADPWARLDDLAASLGVARSALSQWISGARGVGWVAVVEALRRTARRHPEAVSMLVEALAGELLDVRGRWIPETDEDVGDWSEESADVVVTLGKITEAKRAKDDKKAESLSRTLVVEAEQAARAARVSA